MANNEAEKVLNKQIPTANCQCALHSQQKLELSVNLGVGSCENGISDSIPILILGNHRFQNFWKGTHVKIESE